MVTITLKGREIPLLYMSYEMKKVQEEIGPINRAISMVLGRNPEDKDDHSLFATVEHLDAVAKMVRILGNAGLEEAGEEPNLTEKRILRALKPSEIGDVVNACMNSMAEGMESEIPEKKPEGPVDVTLEEINKKKEKDG